MIENPVLIMAVASVGPVASVIAEASAGSMVEHTTVSVLTALVFTALKGIKAMNAFIAGLETHRKQEVAEWGLQEAHRVAERARWSK